MPGSKEAIPVRVEEGNDGWERRVIIVDNVGQIRHRFVTFVDTCSEHTCRGCGGVDGIDRSLPAAGGQFNPQSRAIITYSGNSSATQEASSCSILAITITLSPTCASLLEYSVAGELIPWSERFK